MVVSVAGLLLAGAVGTYVISSFDEPVQTLIQTRADATTGAAGENKASLNLLSFQVKRDDELEALNQKIVVQQMEIKNLSQQLSALLSRVDALELAGYAKPPVRTSPTVGAAMAAARPLKKRTPDKLAMPASVRDTQ